MKQITKIFWEATFFFCEGQHRAEERREGTQNERTAREVSWCFREAVSGHAEEDKRGKETGDKRGMGRTEERKRAIGVTRGARREEVEMRGKKVR